MSINNIVTLEKSMIKDSLKHILLNTVADSTTPFAWYYPKFDYGGLNVRLQPGMEEREIQDAVFELIHSGFMYVSNRDGTVAHSEVFNSAILLIDPDELKHFDYVGLTAKGADQWERFSKPIWESSYDFSTDFEDCLIASPDFNIVISMLLGYFGRSGPEAAPDLSTVTIERVPKYQMTYWKELDNVVVAQFKFSDKSFVDLSALPSLRDWVSGLAWYRYPWECSYSDAEL